MDEITKTIKDFYNTGVQTEWNRINERPEFYLTCRFIDRYIKPGDKVLDIGGGPGRYSLYLAEKGCDVTLFDLSDENVKFASNQAMEKNIQLNTISGDARTVDKDLIVDIWLDMCEKVCEREDLLSWSEHLMYIGRKH